MMILNYLKYIPYTILGTIIIFLSGKLYFTQNKLKEYKQNYIILKKDYQNIVNQFQASEKECTNQINNLIKNYQNQIKHLKKHITKNENLCKKIINRKNKLQNKLDQIDNL